MRFSQVGAAAATVGALSHAFLLPPTISKADSDLVESMPLIDSIAATDGYSVLLPCPGCSIDVLVDGRPRIANNVDGIALKMNLAILPGEDHDTLTMNDWPVWPVEVDVVNKLPSPEADELVQDTDGNWNYLTTPKLGFFYRIHSNMSAEGDSLVLTKVHMGVSQVGGKDVEVPTLDVNLISTPSGKLMIGSVDIGPVQPALAKDCTTIVCKWKAIIADKLAKVKGCGSKAKPQHSRPRPNPNASSVHGQQGRPWGRPHHGRPQHHGHGGYRRHGGLARFVRSLVFHVFIPILIGVAMGITASLVGMIVGHLAIFVWRMVFRRSAYQRVQQEASLSKDDSAGLLENQSPPPVYEEAPAYEEAVADEKQ